MHSGFKFPPRLSHIELLTVGTLDFVHNVGVVRHLVGLFGLDTSFRSVEVGLCATWMRVVSTSARSVQIYPSRRVRGLFECLFGRSVFVSLGLLQFDVAK